jgi:hypothetical protein
MRRIFEWAFLSSQCLAQNGKAATRGSIDGGGFLTSADVGFRGFFRTGEGAALSRAPGVLDVAASLSSEREGRAPASVGVAGC